MTVSTSSSSVVLLGNGATTTFDFPFIGVSASDITVIYTDTTGNQTLLVSSQYTLLLNAAATGQLWGVGGSVTYPTVGSPIAVGTSLTITRIVPYTQPTSISDQGNFYPSVVETALDNLDFQIQQIAARTGQMRGTWATDVQYNFGDVVVDGTNGANTQNYYMCAAANLSGVWATDLAAGDWSLVFNTQGINYIIGNFLPIAGGTITGSLTVDQSFTAVGTATFDSAVILPSNSIINSKLAQAPTLTLKGNNTGGTANVTDLTVAQVNTMLGISAGNASSLSFYQMVAEWASNTVVNLNVTQIVLQNGSGAFVEVAVASKTFNTALSGAGGLDTGSLAINTWYYGYVIYNGTTVSTVFSLNSATPTLPGGYTYYSAPITAFRTDGSNHLIGFIQPGRDWQYKVGSNLTSIPIIISGASGSSSLPTWTSSSIAAFVPDTGAKIKLLLSTQNSGTANVAMCAPNASYGAYNSATNAPPMAVDSQNMGAAANIMGEFILETRNVFYASDQADAYLACMGFTLNL